MIERTMLIRMEVVIGKKKVKFFLWMRISPGSRPMPGILFAKRNRAPTRISIAPKKISALLVSAFIS